MKKALAFIIALTITVLTGCSSAESGSTEQNAASDGDNAVSSAEKASPSKFSHEAERPLYKPTYAEESYETQITIDLAGEQKTISPYIYGINECCDPEKVTATAMRQGGNRYSAYNWENNFSNAGADWYNMSDGSLSSSDTAGQCAFDLDRRAEYYGAGYTLATLQMAGFVSADGEGTVEDSDAAPSKRWVKVEAAKNADFADTPDLTDDVVYMDEYVNYLVKNLGTSDNGGISAYSLDNEPALWCGTHKLVHPDQTRCDELVDKSIELSKSVKAVDANAEIFGPALYGFNAYMTLQEAPDWDEEKKAQYHWFISYYLEKMAEAEKTEGERLLDVLDLHYYSSDEGDCGQPVCQCDDNEHTACIKARMQAPRTLWDPTYTENSWIGKWFSSDLPIIPKVLELIDTYYPGTKLAFSEYNFGGGMHVSGAVAEADALGIFGREGVYFATLWPTSIADFLYKGMELYTNYDGKGAAFGDTSIPVTTSDLEKCTAYASFNKTEGADSRVCCVVTNKDMENNETAEITLDGAEADYKNVTVYFLTDGVFEIKQLDAQLEIEDNKVAVELPPMSVAQVVITK